MQLTAGASTGGLVGCADEVASRHLIALDEAPGLLFIEPEGGIGEEEA